MYKRLELHNHTNESDGVFTCQELTDFLVADHVDAFALTDHNTISGHHKIEQYLKDHPQPITFIPSMEYTTYYGHILCFHLTEYVPWENMNKHKPELLFQAAREKGALVGVAHPYSFGWPFAQGCRFEMTITDYSCCDFIEIFNNSQPLHEVNEKGIRLWEDLVFSGEKLAATSGMDLHGPKSLHGHYSTYIQGEPDGDICQELTDAIHAQRTWVCKGPLLEVHNDGDTFSFSIYQTGKPGYKPIAEADYRITLRTREQLITCSVSDQIPLASFAEHAIIVPMLFEKETVLENLVCVSPVIHR